MSQEQNWFQEKFNKLPRDRQEKVRSILDRYASEQKPATPQPSPKLGKEYLTLVFTQPIAPDVQELLKKGEWVAASHSHAIWDRDAALNELKEQATRAKKEEMTRKLSAILDECEEDPAIGEALRPQLEALHALLERGCDVSR